MSKRTAQMKHALERLYAKYNRRHFIGTDPLHFVYRYTDPADMEIAGFLAALLAYGRVEQIKKSLSNLLGRMGKSPSSFTLAFDRRKAAALKDFKHRFTTGDDISDLLLLLKKVVRRFGGIEGFFAHGYSPGDKNIITALSKFCDSLLDMHATANGGRVTAGLRYLLPRPTGGSPCKRLNLFLRWMVRDDAVDAGLWRTIDKTKLIVPVDVHMGRLCRMLGLYDRSTVTLSAALEITEGFAEINPADPVKYDFALSRIGIIDNCTGNRRGQCQRCELFRLCNAG